MSYHSPASWVFFSLSFLLLSAFQIFLLISPPPSSLLPPPLSLPSPHLVCVVAVWSETCMRTSSAPLRTCSWTARTRASCCSPGVVSASRDTSSSESADRRGISSLPDQSSLVGLRQNMPLLDLLLQTQHEWNTNVSCDRHTKHSPVPVANTTWVAPFVDSVLKAEAETPWIHHFVYCCMNIIRRLQACEVFRSILWKYVPAAFAACSCSLTLSNKGNMNINSWLCMC